MCEIDQNELIRKSREIQYFFFVKSQDKNFRLIPSRKIPGSREFAKSRHGNPGIRATIMSQDDKTCIITCLLLNMH